MAIKMVRVPSETPNISNIDDFAGLRYAYGNQNGYVISKGQECSYTINGSNFKINSGRLVLQGVECDIDANGVNVIIDNVSTTRYYSIYLQVNLALNETKILAQYDTATYPNIDIGNDLTQNTTGTARMELYHFKATSGVISNIEQIVSKIEYSGTALSDYDNSKGTIEERLDALGFREGSITLASGITASTNVIKRQGNYVIGKVEFSPAVAITSFLGTPVDIGDVPEYFRPKVKEYISYRTEATTQMSIITTTGSGSGSLTSTSSDSVTVDIDGKIVGSGRASWNPSNTKLSGSTTIKLKSISFGYEANPL